MAWPKAGSRSGLNRGLWHQADCDWCSCCEWEQIRSSQANLTYQPYMIEGLGEIRQNLLCETCPNFLNKNFPKTKPEQKIKETCLPVHSGKHPSSWLQTKGCYESALWLIMMSVWLLLFEIGYNRATRLSDGECDSRRLFANVLGDCDSLWDAGDTCDQRETTRAVAMGIWNDGGNKSSFMCFSGSSVPILGYLEMSK